MTYSMEISTADLEVLTPAKRKLEEVVRMRLISDYRK